MKNRTISYFLLVIFLGIHSMSFGQRLSLGLLGGLSASHANKTSGAPIDLSLPGLGWLTELEIKYQFHERFAIALSSSMGLYRVAFTYRNRYDYFTFDRNKLNSLELSSRISLGYVINKNQARRFELLGGIGPRWSLAMSASQAEIELGDPRLPFEQRSGTLFYTIAAQSTIRRYNLIDTSIGLFFQNRIPFQLLGFWNNGFFHVPLDIEMTFLTYGLYLKFSIHE